MKNLNYFLLIGLFGCAATRREIAYINGRTPSKSALPTVAFKRSCSAVALDNRHFLTAGHCLTDQQATNWIFKHNQPLQIMYDCIRDRFDCAIRATLSTDAVFLHPNWRSKGFPTSTNTFAWSNDVDLMIVRVLEKHEYPHVRLSSESLRTGDDILVGGYGCTEKNGNASEYLRVAPKKIQKLKSRSFTWPHKDGDGLAKSSLCAGDSGGPVYSRDEQGGLVLVGVNSSAIYSGAGSAVRLDTVEVQTWIRQVLSNHITPEPASFFSR